MSTSSSINTFRLRNLGLPAMSTIEDMSNETRLSVEVLRAIIYKSDFLYKVYTVPKKIPAGALRTIYQPSRKLKALQGWILRHILDSLSSSPFCKGFEKGESILSNATPHIGANFVLNVDLEDFFPSITADKVFSIFKSLGYNNLIASALTRVCCYKNILPQGSPASPKLANLICTRLDYRIHGYAGRRGLIYTRYADDLTLSAQSLKKVTKAQDFLISIIPTENFVINKAKMNIYGPRRQKKVTGLVISQNKVGIGRLKFREMRVSIHYLFVAKSSNVEQIMGMLSYIRSVDFRNYKKLMQYIALLEKKYSWNPFHFKKA